MAYIILNEQSALHSKPGVIHPTVRAHLTPKNEWSVVKRPKRFTTEAEAVKYAAKNGCPIGRYEDVERNIVNVVSVMRD